MWKEQLQALVCKNEEILLWDAFPVSSASVVFSEHAQCWGRITEGWVGGVGVCFQGDGNTRLYTAAAVLCNRAVTMAMFKWLGWRKKGKSSLRLRAAHAEKVQILTSTHKLDRHCRVQRFAKALKAAWVDASGQRDGLQTTLTGWCAARLFIELSTGTVGLEGLCMLMLFTVHLTVPASAFTKLMWHKIIHITDYLTIILCIIGFDIHWWWWSNSIIFNLSRAILKHKQIKIRCKDIIMKKYFLKDLPIIH